MVFSLICIKQFLSVADYLQIEMSTRGQYAAVLTIKSTKAKEAELSLVLSEWLCGATTLLFPPNATDMSIDGYLKLGQEAPKPTDKWLKYAYILKRKFLTYDEGTAYVKQHETAFSEAEDKYLEQLKKLQRLINAHRSKNFHSLINEIHLFSIQLFIDCIHFISFVL